MTNPVHRPGYQRRDYHIVDYQEYELPGTGLMFRGPKPGSVEEDRQITCIGAAQTYGCLVERPFPTIVGDVLQRPVKNLGYGGAGPRFFLENRGLVDEANVSSAVVVQVMSGRSEDNRLFRSGGLEYLRRRSDGARLSASDAYGGLVGGYDPVTGQPSSRNMRRITSRLNRLKLRRVVAETKRSWVENTTRLLAMIEAPTVLLWFSTRSPAGYATRYRTVGELFGEFPQLITADMVAEARLAADVYVEVVNSDGLPQPLFSRFDGTRTTVDPTLDRPDLGGDVWHDNRYYPSPEMHEAAGHAVARGRRAPDMTLDRNSRGGSRRPSRVTTAAAETKGAEEASHEDTHGDGPVDIGRDSVAHSAKWSLVSLTGRQAIRIVFTVVLASLLGPGNFGIVGQAAIYLAFATVFLDVGLAATLIQRPNLNRKLIGTITAVTFTVVGILVGFTLVTAGLWAGLFNTPELEAVIRVLSFTFVFNGLAVVPGALLTRRLDFKRIGIAQVASSVVGGVAGVMAAINGAEYWALVVQILLRDALYAAMVLTATGRPVLAWSLEAIRSFARMSRNVFGSQFLGFLNSHADDFLVAWRLGAAPLANYALSYRILQLPVQVLGQTANRLVLPIFSRLQEDTPKQARYYLSTLASLSLVVVPAMLLVALSASMVVPAVFGSAWHEAIRPMQILAVASIVWALMTINSPVLIANDHAHWLFRYSVVNTAALVGAAVVGLQWGIEGVAWALLIAGIPLAVVLLILTGKLIPISALGYVKSIVPAAVGGLVMVGMWSAAGPAVGPRLGDLGTVIALTLLSGVGFLGVVWLGWRAVFRQQVSLIRAMIGRRDDVAESA